MPCLLRWDGQYALPKLLREMCWVTTLTTSQFIPGDKSITCLWRWTLCRVPGAHLVSNPCQVRYCSEFHRKSKCSSSSKTDGKRIRDLCQKTALRQESLYTKNSGRTWQGDSSWAPELQQIFHQHQSIIEISLRFWDFVLVLVKTEPTPWHPTRGNSVLVLYILHYFSYY